MLNHKRRWPERCGKTCDKHRSGSVFDRFRNDQSGAVLVETAVVLLVLVPLLLGLSELSTALALKRRVEAAALTAADLVTRATEEGSPITVDDLADVRLILDQILQSGTNVDGAVGLRVVRYSIDKKGAKDKKSTITGKYTCKFKGKGTGAVPADILAGLKIGDLIVQVETEYRFTSIMARLIPEPITLRGVSYFTPRVENRIDLSTDAECNNP